MSYALEFSETALSDIEKHKKSGDKAVLKKIEKLLNEVMKHPTTGTGQPEQLKYNLTGLYSRRINQKHRLVYSINEGVVTVHVLSGWAHYGDK
ncbi:MAG: Txe/YoeB family addiction module toxin [Marinilabiliaceae bacterium]|nr:Txe/YoeB family addiction module toxin [Marinilabiliaceae bacterium]